MIEVFLESIRVNIEKDKRVLVLKERAGVRILPLWVGEAEARDANLVVKRVPVVRPQAHDLVLEAIHHLGARCLHAAITGLIGHIYHAKLVLEQDGRQLDLDARPSDAVNVAIRASAPV